MQQSFSQYQKKLSLWAFSNRAAISDPGIINGRMGLCINLYHIAHHLKDEMLKANAECLLNEILQSVQNTPGPGWQFGNGISGIGWGIEHLAQQGFIDADTGESLEDFDTKLTQQRTMGTSMKLSIKQGFTGMAYYFMKRLQNPVADHEHMRSLMNKQNLIALIEQMDYYRESTVNNGLEKLQYVDYWGLPQLATMLAAVHDLDLFNSTVDKLIEWLYKLVCFAEPDHVVFKLSLALTLSRLKSKVMVKDKMRELLWDVNPANLTSACEAGLITEQDIAKTYIELTDGSDNELLNADALFWTTASQQYLYSLPLNDTTFAASGIMDGFNGLYLLLRHNEAYVPVS
ncbi:lanthionine synthetase LanC family protein [uncultured Chitinophaga sp.]|uniref:lanthionine synthetase LanC family protein n=1 Tax=uncultured Chitinophaga sp. TaxID=339340 RepID=UPI0025FC2684|nr:lanthionine synthetase LanC family protein [uncultured Chitinophaga sp.]